MEAKVINDIFASYGIFGLFGILFVCLLVYVLKNNETREKQFQLVIAQYTSTLPSILEGIRRLEESQSEHCRMVTDSMAKIKAKIGA